jgi:hypothetical protein
MSVNFPLKDDFDHEYYLSHHDDLKIYKTLDQLYGHWYKYGCHEGRKIKTRSGKFLRLELPRNYCKPSYNKSPSSLLNKIDVKKGLFGDVEVECKDLCGRIAIMIYVFNPNLLSYYLGQIDSFGRRYKGFDVYLGIVNVTDAMRVRLNKYNNVRVLELKNRGGDIGGFLCLTKNLFMVMESENLHYEYVLYGHTKTNNKWRMELCKSIFNYDYASLLRNLDKSRDGGFNSSSKSKHISMIGSKRWMLKFKDDGKTRYNGFK